MTQAYKCLKGVEVKGASYAPGDVIADLPKLTADWLLERAAVEPIDEPAPAKPSKKKGA